MKSCLPKVMQPLAGQPMLSHVLDAARSLHPEKLIVVYGSGKEHLLHYYQDQKDIVWAEQSTQLGTGDAVRQAVPFFSNSDFVLVLYGDVPCIRPETLQEMGRLAQKQRLVLLTASLEDPSGYGRIVRNELGHVVGIVEQKDATEAQKAICEINTGILLAPTDRLTVWLAALTNNNAQKEYYLTDIVAMAVSDNIDVVTIHPEHLSEIEGANHFAQLCNMERAYQRRLAQQLMLAGTRVSDDARIDIRGTLQCGHDVFIDINCVFEGNVCLGNNVSIGPNCVLKNISIADNTRIDAFSHLDSATIGASANIGPFARIRPGTVLSDEVHIGNFVEIKNANVDKRSKINHLTYIGDADIGQRVNIGAGTITCNYDGVNKHRTVIEDDVFIGSDTQLVAPIVVRKGATVGAGTTLTQEVPMEGLTLSRTPQKTIGRWKRPKKV